METKITIRKSKTATTGYEILNGDGKVLPIQSTYPGEPFTLVLPVNTANRKYFNSKKVDAANGSLQVEYKETKTFGPRDNTTSRNPAKRAAEYLPEEERKQLEALLEKAAKLRAEEKARPLTALEKAKRAKEKADAVLAALLAEQPAVIDDTMQKELDADVAKKAAK